MNDKKLLTLKHKRQFMLIFGIRSISNRGFALISTLMITSLLMVTALSLLSLSSQEVARSHYFNAHDQARANCRVALMLALSELQSEMGPDMRISSEAAIFDADPNSPEIDGVGQSQWLGSYDSWGSWLNAEYIHPASGKTLRIQDTYTPKREAMFRRWLLTLPAGKESDIDASISIDDWDDSNSVVLVGSNTIGEQNTMNAPHKITRAYLKKIENNGRYAWWIGAENHKASTALTKRSRDLTADQWENSGGNTNEIGVYSVSGFEKLEEDLTISKRIQSYDTIGASEIDRDIVKKYFFDFTSLSRGVISSARTGHLKKDLSLLFEREKNTLPDTYSFTKGDSSEPSIRPVSQDLVAKNPVIPERPFASWTRMRHFYRMYRQDSDSLAPEYKNGGTTGNAALNWQGVLPWADCNMNNSFNSRRQIADGFWEGEDSYSRYPILSHLTYILSVKLYAMPNSRGEFNVAYIGTPVAVYWNPYNVELRIPNKKVAFRSYLSDALPLVGTLYNDGIKKSETLLLFDDDFARIMDPSKPVGEELVFKPGEFRIFAPAGSKLISRPNLQNNLDMVKGFDPNAYGGLLGSRAIGMKESEKPTFQFSFTHKFAKYPGVYFGGQTPGSMKLFEYWSPIGTNRNRGYSVLPFATQIDWLNTRQSHTHLNSVPAPVISSDTDIQPIAYLQIAMKGMYKHEYPSINWSKDWRCRNWIQAPPFYLGKGLYISEDDKIAHTQRIDSPYEFRFGPLQANGISVDEVVEHIGSSAILSQDEKVSAVPILELPSAPIGSLAGFGSMRIDPGWYDRATLESMTDFPVGRLKTDTTGNSQRGTKFKSTAYQSGVTGPGIGNSFLHPMIPRTDVYTFFNNSISMDMKNYNDLAEGYSAVDTKAYSDYWDHVFLLNDSLWDDYYISSIADQSRPGASASLSFEENVDLLINNGRLANSRYTPYNKLASKSDMKDLLMAADGFKKSAGALMVEGMFNVNSTSVPAWYALFSGIRERKVVFRNQSGDLMPVIVPEGKSIALSRFGVATTDKELSDPETGVERSDGLSAWSGVRYLDDDQLKKLAEECVKQVKQRGPFLNFSEFINRRLSDDELGIKGALQSAIDYDDAQPEVGSINYEFKSSDDYMIDIKDLGNHAFNTPSAAVGSRFAGIPGYIIQSDLLKPISNTLSVRDDTFRIRAYGESTDKSGKVIARAWCEVIVQRVPEYTDGSNSCEVPARTINSSGEFSDIDNSQLTETNRRFGRRFEIINFKWLKESDI